MSSYNKKRILFLIPSLSIGGLERQLSRMLRRLPYDRYEVGVFSIFSYEGRPSIASSFPREVQCKSVSFGHWANPFSWIRFVKVIRSFSPDLVISSMRAPNVAAALLKPFLGFILISREHNIHPEKTAWKFLVDRYVAFCSFKVVTVSNGVAEFASTHAHIAKEKFEVIHNAIDEADVKKPSADEIKAFRLSLGLLPDETIVLNVARLKKQKRHTLLIDAYETYRKLGGKKRLYIVGDGGDKQEVISYIQKKKIEEHVVLTGYRSDTELFYSIASVFALTSEREGFSNAILEALLFGVPVVSTKVPGSDEVIQEGYNGSVVSDDPDDIGRKLLFFDQKYPEYQKQAKESINRFSFAENVSKYQNLIEQALSRKI